MKTVALGDIVDFYSGGTPSKSEARYWQGTVPWFSAKDMKQFRLVDSADHVSEEVFRRTPLRRLPAGTVTMVVRGMILAHTVPIAILEVDATINQDLKAMLPRAEVDAFFLAEMLRAQHSTILAQVSTAAHGTKKLDSQVLQQLQIPLPPLDEQRRIASILNQCDMLRTKRGQILDHLDKLTRSIFLDMFADTKFESVALKDAIKWSSGRFLPAKDQKHGPHPVYGGNGISGSHDEYMFEAPRLVVGRVGAYCGAVHLTEPFAWVTDNALVATVLRDDLTPEYLLHALKAANLNQYAATSGQPSISAGRIDSVRLSVPPLALQHEFSSRVNRVTTHIVSVRRAASATNELFISLQSKAFRGEL